MVRAKRWFVFVVAFLLCMGGSSCDSAPEPGKPFARVEMKRAFPSLEFKRPVAMLQAPDGMKKWYLLEQDGLVLSFIDDQAASATLPFLDIKSKVSRNHNEEGLLSMAFHPKFKENGRFFVYYSAANPRRSVLSEFSLSGPDRSKADPATERVLLTLPEPWGNHNGGTVLFGPDGYMYLSIGDGGSAGDPNDNGQNLGTLLATIIRIDVDKKDAGKEYAVPADNPFVGVDGVLPEIWAYGLRNVWRMSFDRKTGELWAGDVGQNKWEEVDLIRKGGNYGWNLREGHHAFLSVEHDPKNFIEPVTEYPRTLGLSITGGYVYRGKKLPSLEGTYIYADYALGTIFALRARDGVATEECILLRQPKNIASFAEAENGEMYLLCFDDGIYELSEIK